MHKFLKDPGIAWLGLGWMETNLKRERKRKTERERERESQG